MDVSTLLTMANAVAGQAQEHVAAASQGISGEDIRRAAAFIGAGIAIGFGASGPGLGEGIACGHACDGVAKAPELAGLITRTMLIGQAVAESCGIYALVVALLILFAK